MAITKRLLVVGIFFNIGFAGFCVSISSVSIIGPPTLTNYVFVLDFAIWPATFVLCTGDGAVSPRFLVRCLYLHPAEGPASLHVSRLAKSHARGIIL